MYSNHELNVITYLKDGLSSRDIGDRLSISEKTVKFHLTKIYKKAEVKSRAEFLTLEDKETKAIRRGVNNMNELKNQPTGRITQEQKIAFVDEKFHIGKTISQLHKMMEEVTSEEMNASTVNAACNCVARLNETINTAILAAKFLNER